MMTLTRRSRARVAGLTLATMAVLAAVLLVQTRGDASPVTLSQTCGMAPASATEFGSTAVSGPMKTQITGTPLALDIPGDITATATVLPGGNIHVTGVMNVDIQAKAVDILNNQVKPAIAAQQGQGLANTAYVNMTLTNLTTRFPIPVGTSIAGTPSVASTGPAATAAVNGGNIEVVLGQVAAGVYQAAPTQGGTTSTRLPTLPAFSVTLNADATVGTDVAPGTVIQLHPGAITFDLRFEVGLYFFGGLIAGGVTGPEVCTPTDPSQVLASSTVEAPATTTTTEAPTTTTTEAPTTTTTEAPTTTTTEAPTTTTTEAPTTTTTEAPTTTTTEAPTTTTTEAPTTTTTEAPTTTTTTPPTPEGISGTVTDATSGAGLSGVVVTLMQANPSWVVAGTATTDGSGRYAFTGLAPGTYSARFFDPTGAHERKWWSSKPTYKTADPIVLQPNGSVDASQALGAAPTGQVVGRAQTAAAVGIPNIHVALYTQNDGFWGATNTGPLGYFQFNGVPAGNYYVQYTDPSGTYRSQWYNFKLLFFNANVVTVGDGTVRADALMG